MHRAGKPWSRGALALALSTAMAAALAMDVDRIEVRSRLGEPLLAEIPVTGATPQDLQQLQAQLASSATFARIGLPRPQGVVADLQFEIVHGARPVIRITSTQPVQETFFTFLLQVDAAQGRLVREYSVALGASPTLPAQAAPQIEMPVQAQADAIARAVVRNQDPADALPAPAEIEAAAPTEVPAIPVAAPAPAPIPLSGDRRPAASKPSPAIAASSSPAGRTKPTRTEIAPRDTPRPAIAPVAAPNRAMPATRTVAAPRPGDYVVKPGDHLTGIVAKMDLAGVTDQQAMLALLRTNPQAFAHGNINLLQRGAVLRTPAGAELVRLDPASAEVMVRLQIEQWRSGNMPEPSVESVQVPSASPAAPAAATARSGMAPARLQIAPASQGGSAGSGAAGRQLPGANDLAAADALATRYTEIQEMQARIADLEQAQRAQQRLLEIKDRQLAAQRPQTAGIWPWLVAALALLVATTALWRRNGPQPPGRVASRLSAAFRARGEDALERAAR